MKIADGSTDGLPAVGLPLKFRYADGAAYAPAYRLSDAEGEAIAEETRAEQPPRQEPTAAGQADARVSRPDGSAPLSGIRVVDLTRMAAGPFCTQLLADLGAEVIKIEEAPIGDPTRRNIPYIDGMSSYFLAFNRGKKSVTLDLKEHIDAMHQLIQTADVLIENFRPGVMERLGLGMKRCGCAIRPSWWSRFRGSVRTAR